MRPFAPLVAVWMLVGTGGGTVSTQTWISSGPVLAGSQVLWTTDSPARAVYSSGPVRRLWRADGVAVPDGLKADPQFDYSVSQRLGSLMSSGSTTAFVRTVDLHRVPKCVSEPPLCVGGPLRGTPIRGELWVHAAAGSFRRVAGGVRRPIVVDADVDRDAVLYSDTVPGHSSRVLLWRPHARPVVLTSSRDVDFPVVALAGRYAGWIERRTVEHWPAPPRTLVVYDLTARQVAYRLGVEELGHAVLLSFDLQADGTVVLASNPSPAGGCDGGIAWASVVDPRPHFLPANAIPWEVRIAAGKIAFITRTCGAPTPFRLDVETRQGRILSDSVITYGGFDFDGRRLAYLTSPRSIVVVPAR